MSINRPKRAAFRSSPEAPSPFDPIVIEKLTDWGKAVEGKADDDFKPYVVKATYAVGEFVKHTKFGNGVVTAVEAQKIDVLFEGGERKLVHALS